MGEVLETYGADSITRSSQEDTETRTRGKVLETCDTAVAGEGDAKAGVEGEVRTVISGQRTVVSDQWSVNSGQWTVDSDQGIATPAL